MYQKQRKIRKLNSYIPAAELFRFYQKEKDCVFLDSSLVNQLGQYSIIARCPYLKLEKKEENFWINGIEEKADTFENYLKVYLSEHKDKNESSLPITSGAIGYFSYDYGRERQKVVSNEADIVKIPEAVLTFYDFFIIEDCHKKEVYLVSNGITENADQMISEAEEICKKTDRTAPREKVSYEIKIIPNFEKEEYKQAVADHARGIGTVQIRK